jgi:hypothetical protein
VIGKTHPRFGKHFDAPPLSIQKLAREKYALWKKDPRHPSLRFDERRNGVCVIRVGEHYRALGLRDDDVVARFWIGTHEEYNRFRF